MLKCPIVFFQDNLIFNEDKSCWAAFRAVGYDYDLCSDEMKISKLKSLTRFVANLGEEAQILIIPVGQDINKHFANTISRLNKKDVLYPFAKNHAELTLEYLKKSNSEVANDCQTYILTKLPSESGEQNVINSPKDIFEYYVKKPFNAINSHMKLDSVDILDSTFRYYKKMADEFYKDQKQRLGIRPVTSQEIQWLLKRVNHRGTTKDLEIRKNYTRKPKDYTAWTPYSDTIEIENEKVIRPYRKDIITLFDGVIEPDKRCLKISHSDGSKIYEGFLNITHLPDGMPFPGFEWLFILQEQSIQTEICIHINNIEHQKAMKKIEFKKREITSQYNHIVEADAEVPEDLLLAKIGADRLEKEIKEYKDPLCYTSITLCFASPNFNEMEENLNFVKRWLVDHNFNVERPRTDQFKLYMEMIPGARRYTKDFIIPLPPQTIAAGIFGATRFLGDHEGPYVGWTGETMKSVFLRMGLACELNKSASAVFFGRLGFGKSFNANLLVYLNVLYGGYGLIFDPKGERGHWGEAFPMLEGLLTIVTLGVEEEHRGKLDPFIIYRDNIEEACELAVNVISEIFRINQQNDEFIALMAGVKVIKKQENRSMKLLSQILKQLEEYTNFDKGSRFIEAARDLGTRIELLEEVGMSKLLIGTGKEEAITVDNRLNIIQIQNLKLPGPETKKDDYSQEELLSTVLMMVLGSFAKKFALKKRNTFSMILFDESWALGKTVEGVKLYDFLSRMGRSLYTGCIFNGHSVLDIPTQGIKNTITFKFFFNEDNVDEVKRMLEYINLEITKDNIEMIQKLKNRECIFQDLDGRVGKLTFDAVFDDLIQAFNTTPKTDEEEEPEDKTLTQEEVELIERVGIEEVDGLFEYEEI